MKEEISALMDGELDGHAADDALELLRRDEHAREIWRLYHLISDGMRDTRLLSAGFAARAAERLAAEPTVLAPASLPGSPVRRFALAAAASVAAFALVGWLAFAPQSEAPAPTLAASQPSMVTVPLPSAANDYLLAHQGFSPRVVLQGMAPYVRTVAEHAEETRK